MDDELLTQPAEASDFVKEVTLNTCNGVSPYTVFAIMYDLGLANCDGTPTVLALDNGLPDNMDLALLIGEAGVAREAMEANHDMALVIAAKQARVEPHSKQWTTYQCGLDHERRNVMDFGASYEQRFTKAYNMIH